MRAPLLLLSLAAAGCAGSRGPRGSASAPGTPVIREAPGLAERWRAGRREEARREGQARTEVNGTIIR
jgi:hypothetical protein